MNTIVLSYDNLNTIYKNYRNSFVPYSGETKESYLEWVKNWKANYAQLSKDIRNLKASRKMAEGRSDIERENATIYAKYLRSVATYAIEYRVESKATAAANYSKMKEQVMA